MTAALLSLSGGMDSATLLWYLRQNRQFDVQAVSFRYPSKHNELELRAAVQIATYAGCSHKIIDVTSLFKGFTSNLLQSGGPVPEGAYDAPTMSQTVVPGRNTIFTSILLGLAQSLEISHVALGIHSGDHAIYPDCRPGWLEAMQSVYHEASEGKVQLLAPFLLDDKASILRIGYRLGVPYNLTRTCYTDNEVACGRCGACNERLDAFQEIKQIDPLAYQEDDEEGRDDQ